MPARALGREAALDDVEGVRLADAEPVAKDGVVRRVAVGRVAHSAAVDPLIFIASAAM